MAILTFDEFLKQSGGTPESVKPVATSTPKNVLSQLGEAQSQSPLRSLGNKLLDRNKTLVNEVTAKPAREILGSAKTGIDKTLAAGEALARTAQAPIRALGAVGGAIGDVVGTAIESTGLDEPISKAVQPIAESDPVQKAVGVFKSLPQETQEVLGAIMNTANIPLAGVGASLAKKGLETGVKSTGEVVESGVKAIVENPVIAGTVDMAKSAKENIARVPERVKTNLAEKQAVEVEIQSLPSTKAQIAVRDGVDINDVRDISAIKRTPQVNKLIQAVKEYAGGNRKVDPIEVVGEETVKRFKKVVKQKKEIGKNLGEASKTIGILTKPELQNGVLERLKSVPGLDQITLKPTGLLDFKNTNLESSLSKADRVAIQEAFREAVKWGDGEKAHRFRQTLFETLGGKKKGKVEVTDTQEKAYEAIRAGLSDVIETKSPSYKALSNEYRKIIEPIKELQKRIKTLDPDAEDLSDANLSAGLLTRRITSAASSNPEIRNLLKKLDSVGLTEGSTFENALQLQDMYNILNKYYDIAPKTGFQNLTREAMSDSITGTVKQAIKDVAGKSNAVRQKALEELLDELGVVLK